MPNDETPDGQSSGRRISQAQLRANRANSLKSTGPRTAGGKQASAGNALSHGAFATRSVAVPRGEFAEEQEEVDAYLGGIVASLAPRDAIEGAVAETVAHAMLRHRRAGSYEAACLASAGKRALSHHDQHAYSVSLALDRHQGARLLADLAGRSNLDDVDNAALERATRFIAERRNCLAAVTSALGEKNPEKTGDWTEAFTAALEVLTLAGKSPATWANEQSLSALAELGKYDGLPQEMGARDSLETLDKSTVILARVQRAIESGLREYQRLQERTLPEPDDDDGGGGE